MLTCPKCGATMREVRRGGVAVDRCSDCGGVFLDPGELERITASERAYYDDDDDDDYRFDRRPKEHYQERHHDSRHYKKKKKKRGFLEDLLDIG